MSTDTVAVCGCACGCLCVWLWLLLWLWACVCGCGCCCGCGHVYVAEAVAVGMCMCWVGDWRLVGQGLHHTSYAYTTHPSQTPKFVLFFGLLVFPLHVSRCLLSAFVVLITTYPELSRSSEMLQQSVLQETWNKEHQLPQVFLDPLMKSDEPDEAGVCLGKCRSITASNEIVEHTFSACSADPVQQDLCVLPVQIEQILDSSTFPETICSEHLSPCSSENSAKLSTSSSFSSSSDSPCLVSHC